jgi:hypothetical protein
MKIPAARRCPDIDVATLHQIVHLDGVRHRSFPRAAFF